MNPRDEKRRRLLGRLRPRRVSDASKSEENETAEKILVISAIVIILVIAYYLSR